MFVKTMFKQMFSVGAGWELSTMRSITLKSMILVIMEHPMGVVLVVTTSLILLTVTIKSKIRFLEMMVLGDHPMPSQRKFW